MCLATGAGGFRMKINFSRQKKLFSQASRTPLVLSSGELSGKLPFNSNDSQEFYGEERRRENICAKKKRLTRIRPIHVTRSVGRRTGRVQKTFSMRTRSGDLCTTLLSIFPFLSGRSRSGKGNLNVC